ncbi:MAG: hypothetical protein JNN20_02790 [Betaproteobacteria bacterium]|nr:hypothetical protein [Betaproteobacteria bacterium]
MSHTPIREILTDAIRYWERMRIVYNLVLVLIVLAHLFAGWPQSEGRLVPELAQSLFLLAVLANVAYCAAYPVDIFARLSDLHAVWLRYRWILFAIGMLFAGIISNFFARSLVS